jgi:hypothetical protein
MKEYRSAGGERRLWFEPDEIEKMMADELRRAGMFPDGRQPVVDLEEFLEIGLQVKLDIYARLDPDVLGVTDFRRNTNPLVSVNAGLTSEVEGAGVSPGVRGRWRATLAHEASHVVLHRILFEVPLEQGELFSIDAESRPSLFRCLARDVSFRGTNSDWKEVQANMGMAALLMPAEVFSDVVRFVVGARTYNSLTTHIPDANSVEHRDLVAELSRRFEVSQQAARIRLVTLGLERGATRSMISHATG